MIRAPYMTSQDYGYLGRRVASGIQFSTQYLECVCVCVCACGCVCVSRSIQLYNIIYICIQFM